MLTPSAAGAQGHGELASQGWGAGLPGVDLQLRQRVTTLKDAPHNFLSRQLLLKSPQRHCFSGLFPFPSPLVCFSTACEGLEASHVALAVKNPPGSTGHIRDASSIPGRKVRPLGGGFSPWAGKIPWRRKCNPLQCSYPENPMDRGDWWVSVQRVTKGQTRLKQPSTYA